MDKEKIKTQMAALNPYVEDNIVKPTEKEIRNQDFISWGDTNEYPQYLCDLYESVPTLQTIIDTYVSYICGEEIVSNCVLSNSKVEDLVSAMAFQLVCYGNVVLNVIRNKSGVVCNITDLDIRNVRSDKKNDYFYYSEDFGKKSYGRGKYLKLPVFNQFGIDASTIYFYKNRRYNTYGLPVWASATVSCEIEKEVNKYHLNSIKNNFVGSVMINFNNGVPSDEQKDEIVENLEEKYTGSENASRILVSWNDDKDHAPTVDKIDTEDVSTRYKDLVERTKSEIFTAFKITPNLIGLPDKTTGFNSQEYQDAFALFNKTVISPLQKRICSIFDDIFGFNGSITISPFSIKFSDGRTENKVIES